VVVRRMLSRTVHIQWEVQQERDIVIQLALRSLLRLGLHVREQLDTPDSAEHLGSVGLTRCSGCGGYLGEPLMSGRPGAALGLDRGARPWEHTGGSVRRAEHGDEACDGSVNHAVAVAPGSWHMALRNGDDSARGAGNLRTEVGTRSWDGECAGRVRYR
jgi:hypothetical protein